MTDKYIGKMVAKRSYYFPPVQLGMIMKICNVSSIYPMYIIEWTIFQEETKHHVTELTSMLQLYDEFKNGKLWYSEP
jgi:hypothetical protein